MRESFAYFILRRWENMCGLGEFNTRYFMFVLYSCRISNIKIGGDIYNVHDFTFRPL